MTTSRIIIASLLVFTLMYASYHVGYKKGRTDEHSANLAYLETVMTTEARVLSKLAEAERLIKREYNFGYDAGMRTCAKEI